jgi:hypothetical protein
MRLTAAAATLMLVVPMIAIGCGDDEGPATELEEAIAAVGDGVSPTGVGFGWLEPAAVSAGSSTAGDALGPGADDVIEDAAQIRRGTGFDPASADTAVALTSSYALAVLFKGAEPGRLPELLTAAGAKSRESGDWTLYKLGGFGHGETAGPLAPFGALVSRIAIGPQGVVLARFRPARDALISEPGTLAAESPKLRAAAGCLGEVAAARMQLGTHTYNQRAAPDLTAVGLREDGREVLCAIDDSEEDSERQRAALEEAFAPEAVDVLTGEPISNEFASAGIDGETEGDLYVARAELEPAQGAEPGHLFRALVRGSALTYLGAPNPGGRGDA